MSGVTPSTIGAGEATGRGRLPACARCWWPTPTRRRPRPRAATSSRAPWRARSSWTCWRPSAAGTPPRPPRRPCATAIELVVAHGGDGTLNEVVNGVLAATGRPAGRRARRPGRRHRPRRLGQRVRPRPRASPRRPRWRPPRSCWSRSAAGRSRLVGLGHAQPDGTRPAGGSRSTPGWAGTPRSCGRRARAGRGPGGHPAALRRPPPAPVPRATAQTALDDRRHRRERPPSPTCGWRSSAPPTPWTYLGSRAVRTNPGSVIGAGLGVFGLRDLGAGTVASTLRHILRTGGDPHGRNVLRQDAVGHVRVRADRAGRPAGGRRTPGRPPRCAVSCGNRCATGRCVRRTVSGPEALCHHTHG